MPCTVVYILRNTSVNDRQTASILFRLIFYKMYVDRNTTNKEINLTPFEKETKYNNFISS